MANLGRVNSPLLNDNDEPLLFAALPQCTLDRINQTIVHALVPLLILVW